MAFLPTLFLILFNLTSVAAWKPSTFPSQQQHVPPQTTSYSYIVHTLNTSRPAHFLSQHDWYKALIKLLPTSRNPNATVPKPQIFHIYQTVMKGFAATLTPEQAQMISENDGVIAVYRDQLRANLQTTHSPDFMGLSADYGIWPESSLGSDVIIGLLDTGIWPESQSFNDSGLAPVGPRWQGECEAGTRFDLSMCNNKLIGARFFKAGAQAMGSLVSDKDYILSPRDQIGHGTHASSIAAGSAVLGASLQGKANGTARGMAPNARIAMYKVCWQELDGCASSDILAGLEKAIEDGVDILSISLGNRSIPYYEDPVAIGAFAAAWHGIFVACAAGNDGPDLTTVANTAPWCTTVAAGSIDREFSASVTLGSGEVLSGESLYFEVINGMEMLPIIGIDACDNASLVPSVIMGKIVVCMDTTIDTGFLIEAVGGAGLISINDPSIGETSTANSYTLPSLFLGYDEGEKLIAYLSLTTKPIARLEFNGHTLIGKKRAPQLASYSSRGPNYQMPELLKPDILAPGNNILAAWPSETPISSVSFDPRRSDFNILSGTSMACPHVAGAAALLRHLNPTWSPAMIRSAMMTTALVLDNRDRNIKSHKNSQDATPLGFGAGHVHPQAANDPGLVYDAGFEDYMAWLCKLNYTSEQVGRFVPSSLINCNGVHSDTNWDLNYPSFAVVFKNQTENSVLRRRTLTKVSDLPEKYAGRVVNLVPDKVAVAVKPETLDFSRPYEKKSYTVQFVSKVSANATEEYGFAYIIWENEEHQVKSPVVFIWSGNEN